MAAAQDSQALVLPTEVDEVPLAAEPERGQAPEPVFEQGALETDRREVRVLEERAREVNAAEEIHEVGQREIADPGELERPGVADRADEARAVGGGEELARELDPRRHVPPPGVLFGHPGHGEVVGHRRPGARVAGHEKRPRERTVERVGELDVPVADEPPRVRVHVLPSGKSAECRGVRVVAGAEVRHQHLDPAEAAGAEPILFERPAGGPFSSGPGVCPVGARGLDLERALEEPGVHPCRFRGAVHHVPLL